MMWLVLTLHSMQVSLEQQQDIYCKTDKISLFHRITIQKQQEK